MDTETLLRGVSLSEEFACDLGDPRRTRRLQRVAERLSLKPELSLPELFDDPSELEATYRLLRNRNMSLLKAMSAHVAATAQRCEGLETVLAVHDTTERRRRCIELKHPWRDGTTHVSMTPERLARSPRLPDAATLPSHAPASRLSLAVYPD